MCGFDWNCYVNFFNFDFGQQFFAGLMATFIGAILGVGGALWLDGFIENKSIRERKKKILRLIKEELLLNFGTLSHYEKKEQYLARAIYLQVFIKTEIWRTFSDGGELQWIKDPVLLSNIAETYNFIRMQLTLADRYIELLHLSTYDPKHDVRDEVVDTLNQGVRGAMGEISRTLNLIVAAEKL